MVKNFLLLSTNLRLGPKWAISTYVFEDFNQDSFNQEKKPLNLRCHLLFKDENNDNVVSSEFLDILIEEKTTLELFEMMKHYFVPVYLEASY